MVRVGFFRVVVVGLRSSELKTWPFWRTRARGSAMFCDCGCVGIDSWLVGVWCILKCDTRFFTDAVLACLLLEMACESDVGHLGVERLGFRLALLHRRVNNLSLQLDHEHTTEYNLLDERSLYL